MGPIALKASDPSDVLSTHYMRHRARDTDKYVTASVWAEFESVFSVPGVEQHRSSFVDE